MTGEALMTHFSGTPEILFQIFHAHLHRGNFVFVEQVKKFTTFHSEHFGSLTLRKSPLLEPTQHCRHKHLAPKTSRVLTKHPQASFRDINCELSTHRDNLSEPLFAVKTVFCAAVFHNLIFNV